MYYILFYNVTKENSCGTQNRPHSILQYQPYGKPTQAAPINMALTPDADPNSLLPLHDQDQDLTDNMITEDILFTLVTNKKEKPKTRTNTIPSFFHCRLLPPSPVTVATAVGNDHPEAPPTKKRISAAGSPQPSAPPSGPTLSTNCIFYSIWLRTDIPMTDTDTKSPAKEILQAFTTLTSIAWTINPFLSFLLVLQTSKYSPLAHGSAIPLSVHMLKHYLKNSNITTSLKQGIQGPPTFCAHLQTHSSISAISLTHQMGLIHPDWYVIIGPYDGMLTSPCRWLLFSSPHIQRVALANQLQTIFHTSSNIDRPLQCIWTNIQGIGDYQRSTAPAIQIKCHPSHKQAIQTLFLEIFSPTAIDKEDPQYIF